MGNSHLLFESLFKKNLLANDTKDFLTTLTKEYPFFTAAQFYLLQQTQSDSFDYDDQLAKTAILFNNPFWLNYQLNQTLESTTFPGPVLIKQPDPSIAIYDAAEEQAQIIPSLAGVADTIVEDKEIIGQARNIEEEAVIEKVVESAAEGIESSGDNIEPAKFPMPVFTTIEEINETKNKDEDVQPEEDEQIEEKEIEPINFKLNFTNTTPSTEDTISFEPLHRSDYFASVGIKLSEEVKPGDKLGKQLKSFTDWLKTMKKIHPDQLPLQTEQSEIIIQQMAEKSNMEGEVLTEAMAEVLLQQGKLSKAIEVYQKLSLLNPSKSAYFAAKIGQIER